VQEGIWFSFLGKVSTKLADKTLSFYFLQNNSIISGTKWRCSDNGLNSSSLEQKRRS
jgi:hypothetical protein